MDHLFFAIICMTIAVFMYGFINIHHIRKTPYRIITQKKLSRPYKIILISDLHYENVMNYRTLPKYIDEINDEHADLIVLAGDIVDERTGFEGMKNCFRILGNLKSQFGTYFVYGNHEYKKLPYLVNFTEEELKQTIEQNGIHILKDRHVLLNDEIIVIGRDDRIQKNRKSMRELLHPIDRSNFLLLLDHQPVELKQNAELKIDLQLSGHTHNGQVFPVGILTQMIHLYEHLYGYKRIDDFQLIVSSGMTGWGYLLRTEGKSEYVVITLESSIPTDGSLDLNKEKL